MAITAAPPTAPTATSAGPAPPGGSPGATPWSAGASSCRTSSASPLLTLVPVVAAFALSFTKWNSFSTAEWVGPGQLPAAVRQRHASGSRCATPSTTRVGHIPLTLAALAGPRAAAQPQAARRARSSAPPPSSRTSPRWSRSPSSGTCCSARRVGPINEFLRFVGIAQPARLDVQLRLGDARGHHHQHLAGHGLLHDPVPGRPADHPRELYEAAEVDGASAWQRFWHVTLPACGPPRSSSLIMLTISSLQGLRPDPGHDRRRPRPVHARAVAAHLPEGHRARASSATRRPSRWCCSSSCSLVTVVQFRLNKRRER